MTKDNSRQTFEARSILGKLTKRELMLGIILLVFWVVLQFFVQYAAIVYPFVAGLVMINSILAKQNKENHRTVFKSDQSEDLKKVYEKMNHMAHDFRAPLAGLKMACEQLSKNPENQQLVLTMTKTFPKQVDKLLTLTTELSKSSKEFVKF